MFAQLYSLGTCHGVHPFLVQLRDFNTHKPSKGITIGEIGPKVGFNAVNNGFLGFDSVRIPLKNMLMKNAKVLENGEFVKTTSSVLTYGVMTLVRVNILRDQAAYLAKAATIAMRYSVVRRQSPIDPSLPEPKIIEHVTQQKKVFPAIAKTVVFKLTADNLFKMYYEVSADIEHGILDRLPELHAISCCLKSVCTNESTKTVQTLRLACGGHGYLSSAGFNDIYGCTSAAQAYEGENTVLFLQTARFLIKAWQRALRGEGLTPTVQYFKNYTKVMGKRDVWDGSLNGILRALQSAAAGKVALAFNRLQERKKRYSTNQTSIELASAAEIHCQMFFLQSAIEMLAVSAKEVSPTLSDILSDIVELYAVDLALNSLASLLQVSLNYA